MEPDGKNRGLTLLSHIRETGADKMNRTIDPNGNSRPLSMQGLGGFNNPPAVDGGMRYALFTSMDDS